MIKTKTIHTTYCDICGEETENVVSESPHEGMPVRLNVTFNYNYGDSVETEHICTDCHTKLLKFLESLAKEQND